MSSSIESSFETYMMASPSYVETTTKQIMVLISLVNKGASNKNVHRSVNNKSGSRTNRNKIEMAAKKKQKKNYIRRRP
jgi:predicted alpha/beta superfamily hydrolase